MSRKTYKLRLKKKQSEEAIFFGQDDPSDFDPVPAPGLIKEYLDGIVEKLMEKSDGTDYTIYTGVSGAKNLEAAVERLYREKMTDMLMAGATNYEYAPKSAAEELVHRYSTVLLEYDIPEEDKIKLLVEISDSYENLTGMHITTRSLHTGR